MPPRKFAIETDKIIIHIKAKDFIIKHVASLTDEVLRGGAWIDAKSLFQEKAQEVAGITPIYKLTTSF